MGSCRFPFGAELPIKVGIREAGAKTCVRYFRFRSPSRKLFYQSRHIHFFSSFSLGIGIFCTMSPRVNRIRLHSSGGSHNSTELIFRLQDIELSASVATGVVFGAEGTEIVSIRIRPTCLRHSVPNASRDASGSWLASSGRSAPNPLEE